MCPSIGLIAIGLIAIGLILALAVQVEVGGLDLQLIGWILAVVGVVGLVPAHRPTEPPDDHARRGASAARPGPALLTARVPAPA